MMTMLVALAAMAAAAQGADNLPGWLVGDWACRGQMLAGGPTWRSETWERDDWSGITGVVRGGQRRAGSALAEVSLARILDVGDSLVLSYSEGSGPVREFRAMQSAEDAITFQADDGGTPERIVYRRHAVSLTVTHSRRDGSDARSWRYARVGIHTGIPEC